MCRYYPRSSKDLSKTSDFLTWAAHSCSTVPFLRRLNALVAICLLQAWLMWNFINFHLRRKRENRSSGGAAGGVVTRSKNKQQAQAQKRKEKRANDDLPEVDQNTSLRQRNKWRGQTDLHQTGLNWFVEAQRTKKWTTAERTTREKEQRKNTTSFCSWNHFLEPYLSYPPPFNVPFSAPSIRMLHFRLWNKDAPHAINDVRLTKHIFQQSPDAQTHAHIDKRPTRKSQTKRVAKKIPCHHVRCGEKVWKQMSFHQDETLSFLPRFSEKSRLFCP